MLKTKKSLRWLYGLGLFIFIFIFLALLTNVSTKVDEQDEIVIKLILGIDAPPVRQTFDDEIRVIRWAQERVLQIAPGMEPIPDYASREPIDLLKAHSGLCYDRSRTLDKIYKWLGFESRHVYILFAKKGVDTNAWQFLRYAISHSDSHAVTEVKTTHGWLMVDSNSAWISVNQQGQPIQANEIHERRHEFFSPPDYVNVPLWAIRGMYSRRGQLYSPFLLYPDFNWPDFLIWSLGM